MRIRKILMAAGLAGLAAFMCIGPAEAHAPRRHHLAHRHHHLHRRVRVAVAAQPQDFFAALFGAAHVAQTAVAEVPARLDWARGRVAELVRAKAEALGVPVRLALAIAHYESGFRMSMRGRAGERGAMQVLPQTARHVGVRGNLYGPAGIEAGVRYLKEALATQRRYGLCAALSAYNHGIGRVGCTHYGRAILALASAGRGGHT